MVAVLVHEVVGVAFVLLAHLLHDPFHILLCEVGAAQDYGFSVQTSGEMDMKAGVTKYLAKRTSRITSRHFI